jgi:hypothetical protein
MKSVAQAPPAGDHKNDACAIRQAQNSPGCGSLGIATHGNSLTALAANRECAIRIQGKSFKNKSTKTS